MLQVNGMGAYFFLPEVLGGWGRRHEGCAAALGFAIHDFELVFAFGGEVDDVAAEALAVGAAFAKKGGQRLSYLRSLVFAGAFLERVEHGFQAFHAEEQLERAGEFFGIAR